MPSAESSWGASAPWSLGERSLVDPSRIHAWLRHTLLAMSAGVKWICVFIDNPREHTLTLESFWSGVTGHPVSPRRGADDELAAMQPPDGDAHLWFQEIEGDPRFHPDLLVRDVAEAERQAVDLGAEVVSRREDLTVLKSPGGMPFCLVRHEGQSRRPQPVSWAKGASMADQLCLDIPTGLFEEEARFWTALTGWDRSHGDRPEFDDLLPGPELPMHFLLQRLDETGGVVRAHLDLACDDRDAEAERHRRLGAAVVHRTSGWTVMRDPAGRIYCVTDRPAGVEKQPQPHDDDG